MDDYEYIEMAITLIILLILLFILSGISSKGDGYEETNKIKILIEDRIIENCKVTKEPKQEKRCKIPRRIIQTYFCREVPERMHNATVTFKELNPDFSYIFYDDQKARDFLVENFDKKVVEAFDILIPGAYKADLFRICELYINGGYYADIFMEDLEPLTYFEKYDADLILTRDLSPYAIYNAFMASCPKNDFLKFLIEKTTQNVLNRNMGIGCLDITGPSFIGRNFKAFYNLNKIEVDFDKKILILQLVKHIDHNFIQNKNFQLVKTKYNEYQKDIIGKNHYSELYKLGKIFKTEKDLI